MYNKRIRKYVRLYLVGRNSKPKEEIYLDFVKYTTKFRNKSITKKLNLFMKSIIIDYSRCPYCGKEYINDRCYVGNEFYDDNIDTCCLQCAVDAGLNVC